MRKATLFISAATLGASLFAVTSPLAQQASPDTGPATAMGFLIDNKDGHPVGWYSFPVTDAAAPVNLSQTPSVSAGAMADGVYYALTYTAGPPTPESWNTLDTATGELTKLADCTEEHKLYVDMTYDHSADRLLAIYHFGSLSTALCTVNPADGKPLEILAEVNQLWLATLACTYDGDIYAIAADGWLYTFDSLHSTFSRVGSTGLSPEYMQSMEFDHTSGTLYWACTTWSSGNFYKVDTTTGAVTLVSSIGNDEEMTGLYISYRLADDDAPAQVKGFAVANPQHDANISLTMSLPSATVAGEPLAEITSVVLEQDGTVLKTFTGAELVPGAAVQLDAEGAEGVHKYKVYAVNAAGNGLPRTVRTCVGLDIPAAPASVTVTADGSNASISWEPVTSGANGGWVDPAAITYEVKRAPGDVVVATALTATSATDVVESTDVYTYTVTASNLKGSGAAVASEPVMVGEGMEIPYTYDFEDEAKLLLWSNIDGNGDGAKWERTKTMDGNRTMIMRGNYSRTVDDWLISPPLKLEAGKSYKIVYDAGCMNESYPPTYDVTFGRTATIDGQQVLSTVTTDRLMLNKSYVYLPEITESGVYHIGFHAHWEPSLANLYVSNVSVEENVAARLNGTVTDGTNPVEGATVTFGEGDAATTYTTDANGNFEVIEIEAGTYTVKIEKFGFATLEKTMTFAQLENKHESFTLTSIPTATVSGKVVNAEGRGLENASVYIHGYDTYCVQTDKDGNFSAPAVYCQGDYTADVHLLNYESATRAVAAFTADTDLGTITLEEKLVAPADVAITADRTMAEVSWKAPQDTPAEFRYDDGTDSYVFSMEMSGNPDYYMVGVVYDIPAVFNAVFYNIWNPKNAIDLFIFDLDEDGKPTNTIIYRENDCAGNNGWNEHQLRYPVVAPRGALICLRGDARICMDTSGSNDNPQWPARKDKMVISFDYRSEPFTSTYPEGDYIFRGNLTLRATGLPFAAPRQAAAREAEAPSVTYDIWRLAADSQNDFAAWTKLNSEPLTETAYTDNTWADAAKGEFRFAVKANYTGGFSSYAALSPAVPHLLHSAATFTLLTNAPDEDASGAAAVLAGKESTDSYSGTADEQGIVRFENVREGIYVLTVTKKGFDTLSQEIEISGAEDYASTFTLAETTKMPENLLVEETEDAASRLLRWNVLQGLFEDFEGHEDFAINSPGDLGWSYIDGDGSTENYSSPDYEYPHKEEPAAFQIMNPYNTVPSMVDHNHMDTHSGQKVLMGAVSRYEMDNDDYIISPRLNMKEDFVINFWLHGYWWRNTEIIRVGYSTSGMDREDFTWVGDPITVDFDNWESRTVNIPKEAQYVCLNYMSNDRDGYWLIIDDIYIGPADQIPGITAYAPLRVAGKATSYDVYLDNRMLANTTETEYLLQNLADGNHTAGVVARYASGDTEMATVDFTVTTSGIDEISGEVIKVRATQGAIKVSGASAGNFIRIYRPDGVCVATATSEGSPLSITVASGVYYVRVGDTTFPVSVR